MEDAVEQAREEIWLYHTMHGFPAMLTHHSSREAPRQLSHEGDYDDRGNFTGSILTYALMFTCEDEDSILRIFDQTNERADVYAYWGAEGQKSGRGSDNDRTNLLEAILGQTATACAKTMFPMNCFRFGSSLRVPRCFIVSIEIAAAMVKRLRPHGQQTIHAKSQPPTSSGTLNTYNGHQLHNNINNMPTVLPQQPPPTKAPTPKKTPPPYKPPPPKKAPPPYNSPPTRPCKQPPPQQASQRPPAPFNSPPPWPKPTATSPPPAKLGKQPKCAKLNGHLHSNTALGVSVFVFLVFFIL